MDRERRVQVVLGEAGPGAEMLRFVLEGEGFDIIGLASSDEELERVVRSARPSVIVLGAGISATAALDAKERAHGARLVVVWPEGVAAVIAEERVDPHSVIDDLGDAVRSASLKAAVPEPVIRAPELLPDAAEIGKLRTAFRVPALVAPTEDEGTDAVRIDGSLRRVLMAVATSILVLTSLTTIAVAMPNALVLFSGGREPRPSPSAVAPSPSSGHTSIVDPQQSRTGSDEPSAGSHSPCQPGKGPTNRGKPSTDRKADRDHSKACRTGGEKGDGHSDGEKRGGRPVAPGHQGKGHSNGEKKGGRPVAPGHQGNQGRGPNADRAGGSADKSYKPDTHEEAKGESNGKQPDTGAPRRQEGSRAGTPNS